MKNDLRVTMTRRMLKEGLLRSMTQKPISKITVTDLCREAGVNRATFYHHYDSPAMVLKDIAEDYASELREVYHAGKVAESDIEHPLEACLEYLYERKEPIKVLLSENAENSITGLGLSIINEGIAAHQDIIEKKFAGSYEDCFLYAVLTASAAYGLIQVWLTKDIQKTPGEIVDLLKKYTMGGQLLR